MRRMRTDGRGLRYFAPYRRQSQRGMGHTRSDLPGAATGWNCPRSKRLAAAILLSILDDLPNTARLEAAWTGAVRACTLDGPIGWISQGRVPADRHSMRVAGCRQFPFPFEGRGRVGVRLARSSWRVECDETTSRELTLSAVVGRRQCCTQRTLGSVRPETAMRSSSCNTPRLAVSISRSSTRPWSNVCA